MKIAVYTIAKNEEQFVDRWIQSASDADCILILDTGSTDNTFAVANQALSNYKGCGILESFSVVPWRFDTARNKALDLLPDDIDLCVALDMDEVLVPGWREHLESISDGVTRPRYKYVWSWNDDGTEGLVYGGDKIHARHGYVWKHPVHEVITPTIPEVQEWVGLQIHHHPDNSKSRGQYFDLLKLAVEEDPNDDRNQFYLGREYFFHGNTQDAMVHLDRATQLSRWNPEIAAAFRLMYKCSGNVEYLFSALKVDVSRRETLVAMAQHYHNVGSWLACHQFAVSALSVTEKPLDYLCEADAWGWLPYDLAAISAWHLGRVDEAQRWGVEAVRLNPGDERLVANLGWYSGASPSESNKVSVG